MPSDPPSLALTSGDDLPTQPVGAPEPHPGDVPCLPTTIGHYRILRLIGEGGMGAVYEAEQEQPRRTVALKVIKPVWRGRNCSDASSMNRRRSAACSIAVSPRLTRPGRRSPRSG